MRHRVKTMGDWFSGLTLGDQLELGTASLGGGVDHETLNAMIRAEQDERALTTQVQKYGPGHGRDAVAQAVAPGATPPEGGPAALSNTAHYEVLLTNPGAVHKTDPKKEATYRLRKAMGLV